MTRDEHRRARPRRPASRGRLPSLLHPAGLLCVLAFQLCNAKGYNGTAVDSTFPKKTNNVTENTIGRTVDIKYIPSSLYISYANDPFGPSKKILGEKKNLTTYLIPRDSFRNDLESNSIESSDPKMNNHKKLSFEDIRAKRGVLHLYNMVACGTGCNPISYKGYGCYCGFLGSGYAVDGIDRCCKMHDWCYNTANCPMYLEYFVPYYWKCYRRRPICAIEHGEWGGAGSCAQRLCECDKALSECLGQYPCPRRRAICKSSTWRLFQNAFMLF